MIRICENCKYNDYPSYQEPCDKCSEIHSKAKEKLWEPTEQNKCLTCGELHPVHAFFCKHSKHVDNVNKPIHYTQGKTETIDYIQDKLTEDEFIGAMKFNIIKYISRERLKNGLEDVKKCEYYIKKLIMVMEDKNND